MPSQMQRAPIRIAIAAGLAGTALAAFHAPWARAQPDPEISRTQSLPARQLSPLLPDRPLARWLPERLGSSGVAVWERNDCGERTGGPADTGRDLPLCVEVWVKLRSAARAGLLVEVGNQSKRWSGRPRIRTLYVRAGEVYRDYRTVRAWLAQIDLVNRMAR